MPEESIVPQEQPKPAQEPVNTPRPTPPAKKVATKMPRPMQQQPQVNKPQQAKDISQAEEVKPLPVQKPQVEKPVAPVKSEDFTKISDNFLNAVPKPKEEKVFAPKEPKVFTPVVKRPEIVVPVNVPVVAEPVVIVPIVAEPIVAEPIALPVEDTKPEEVDNLFLTRRNYRFRPYQSRGKK
jgi:hypothetical protein